VRGVTTCSVSWGSGFIGGDGLVPVDVAETADGPRDEKGRKNDDCRVHGVAYLAITTPADNNLESLGRYPIGNDE
jgi:hypothetical protein